MYQYIYSAAELGFSEWPSGTLRLEGIEVTANPDKADIFVCPGNLSLFKDDLGALDRMPYMSKAEARHVLFDVSDNFTKAIGRKCIFIRCDIRRWMLKDDPGAISFAWPVEDYKSCCDLPPGGFLYDVSFQGWLSTDARIHSSRSCQQHSGLKCDIAEYSDFTGYIYYTDEGVRRRAEFRRSMRESRVSLCAESIPGVLPYRFFEAMSAGRVPVLVSSDFCLPFESEIPYARFMLRIPRDEALTAGAQIRAFLNEHSDEELVRMGLLARQYWQKYMNRDDWPKTMAYAVTRKLQELGMTSEGAELCA